MARPNKNESVESDDQDIFDDEQWDEDEDDWDEDADEETEEDEDDEDSEEDEYADVVERAKTEAIEEIVNAIASGDQTNKVYTGLQRVINRKDKEIDELKKALDTVVTKLDTDDEDRGNQGEVLKFLLEQFVEIVGEDEAKGKLNALQTGLQSKRIEKLEKQQSNPRPQRQQPSQDEDEQLKEYKRVSMETLQEYAEDMGVDPEDKKLDYGAFEDGIANRMKKLKASIQEIKKEKSITGKGKSKPVTKTGATSVPKATGSRNNSSRFEKGINDQFTKMLKLARQG